MSELFFLSFLIVVIAYVKKNLVVHFSQKWQVIILTADKRRCGAKLKRGELDAFKYNGKVN